MKLHAISIRTFIGAKNYEQSQQFYREIGFDHDFISPDMCRFEKDGLSFYLQDYYVKEWAENTMIFLEVENAQSWWEHLLTLNLETKYPGVKVLPVKKESWGEECFLIDPAGVLWHFGMFY